MSTSETIDTVMGKGLRSHRRVTGAMAAIAIALALAAGACVDDSADPDNVRLEAIEDDPVFELEPPGATILEKSSKAAIGDQAFNFPDQGPSVIQSYRVDGSPDEVLQFFRSEIPGHGWQFKRSEIPPGGQYPTLTFEKDFGGWEANLSVHYFEIDQHISVTLDAPPVTEQG